MTDELKKYIEENSILLESDSVLLAVSGGIDSMVMAHLFLELPYKIAVAHCNFSLRGQEADGDEAFVEDFAKKNNLKFHSVKFDTNEHSKQNKISIQMAARELRYNWFNELMDSYGYTAVALAHNLTDNNETFLINLTRGTGIRGLTGMKPKTGRLARPLLFASREMIAAYAGKNNIDYREDRTNSDTKYTRNKIRKSVIPLLREINENFDFSLADTIEKLAGSSEILDKYFTTLRNEMSSSHEGRISFNIEHIIDLKPVKTHLFELFSVYGLNSKRVDELVKLLRAETGSTLTTPSHILIKSRNEIIVEELSSPCEVYMKYDSLESLSENDAFFSAELIDNLLNGPFPNGKESAVFDLAAISFPVVVRNWKHGDWFIPFGMEGRKKLSDFLAERKIPSVLKEKVLVAESAGNIFWVIGERTDNRFAVKKLTAKILKLTVRT